MNVRQQEIKACDDPELRLESSIPELLKECNMQPTPFDPTRVRAMKAAGHTIAEICAVFNISAGLVQKCTARTRLDKMLRQKADEISKRLQKSSIPANEPLVIQK